MSKGKMVPISIYFFVIYFCDRNLEVMFYSWSFMQMVFLCLGGSVIFHQFLFYTHILMSWHSGCILQPSLLSSWEVFCYLKFSRIQYEFSDSFEGRDFRIRSLHLFFYVAPHALNSVPQAPPSECHRCYPLHAVDKETPLIFTMSMFLSHLTPFQTDTTSDWYLVLWGHKVLVVRALSQLRLWSLLSWKALVMLMYVSIFPEHFWIWPVILA